MSVLYLVLLLCALGFMVALDRRYALVFWRDARRAAVVTAAGLAFFLVWDVSGIAFRIFSVGEKALMTGVLIGPQLPLEEVFFLLFLCYLTMVLVMGARRVLIRRKGGAP